MTTTTTKISFEEFVSTNFQKLTEEESKKSLGDRSKYIGASDVGGCPYQVIKSKLDEVEEITAKSTPINTNILKTVLLIFNRLAIKAIKQGNTNV